MLTLKKNVFLTALFTAAGLLSVSSLADAALPGFYAGGQLGWGDTHYSSGDINNIHSATVDNTGVAGRLFGGYQFDPNWAFELGYTQFAKTKFSHIIPSNIGGNIHQRAIDGLFKGTLPLDNGFSLFADAGIAYVDVNASGSISEPANRFNPAFGAGASYDITSNVPVFIAWNRIQKLGGSVPSTDLFSLGAAYNFG